MKTYPHFISFEGIDFSGKTTQIRLLMERLKTVGVTPLLVREPGGTVISEKIRDILLNPDHEEMHEITEILLYEAARSQLVHQQIIPELERGHYVIADRFFDSTTCYQGYGRGLDKDMVKKLNLFATSGLTPYKTFFVDLTLETAMERQARTGRETDRLESGGQEFFKRIRQGFLNLCEQEPGRFIQIDGTREERVIAEEIWRHMTRIWDIRS